MSGNSILLACISLFLLTNVYNASSSNFLQEIQQVARRSKSSFDAKFYRGQCPDYFYQLGDECIYFSTDGGKYSWQQTKRICAVRLARLLEQQSINVDRLYTTFKGNVRQLILNTPEKTEILQALYRDFEELNYAVRLPPDYNKIDRCHDEKDDLWLQYCYQLENLNSTCFATNAFDSSHICLRPIDCNAYQLRFACEFTLPGKAELSSSKFRQCPKVHRLPGRLSIWAWLLIAFGIMLLLLLLLGGILALIRSIKIVSLSTKSSPRS